MSDKRFVFQYATSRQIIEDTELITESEADALLDRYKHDFTSRMEYGERPEIAIWMDMDETMSFKKTKFHIHADDLVIEDGIVYEKRRVFD